jgi:hypothetical protein
MSRQWPPLATSQSQLVAKLLRQGGDHQARGCAAKLSAPFAAANLLGDALEACKSKSQRHSTPRVRSAALGGHV